MKKGRMNKILLWGIILNALRLFLDRFIEISDFLSGVILGISIAMMLIGIYSTSRERNKDIEVKKDSENI